MKYSNGLWAREVTSTSQLGNASVTSYLACGIHTAIHAEDIVAQSKPTRGPAKRQKLAMMSFKLVGAVDTRVNYLVRPAAFDELVSWVGKGLVVMAAAHVSKQERQQANKAVGCFLELIRAGSRDTKHLYIVYSIVLFGVDSLKRLLHDVNMGALLDYQGYSQDCLPTAFVQLTPRKVWPVDAK
ncbi:hypothetical protein WJX77_001553 [Trebouxia sp. C0004]